MQETFDVNLLGTVYGSVHAYRHMKRRGGGTIVNIISSSGREGKPGESVYCASKFGVSGFTDALRKEAKEHGVKIIALYQGGMQTAFFERERPDMDASAFMDTRDVAEQIVHAIRSPPNMQPTLYLDRL